MQQTAFQDRYPDEFAHCYGCGRLNQDGLQIKSYWDGDESVCHFKPRPSHTGGFPGYAYGGLITSLIDCHGAGTAAAAKALSEGQSDDHQPLPRFVTASLKVDFIQPTPIDTVLELRGRVNTIKGRKVIVEVDLLAAGKICAKGSLIMIQITKEKD